MGAKLAKISRDDDEVRAVPVKGPDLSLLKDVQGGFRTSSLFKEKNFDKKYPSFFTLKESTTKDHISMKEVYMEEADPTEYKVAQRLLGSWDHWCALQKAEWFRIHLERWRAELKTKLKSEAIAAMREFAKRRDGTGFAANKHILEMTEDKKPARKAGAPSREEIQRELELEMRALADTSEDAERLGIK